MACINLTEFKEVLKTLNIDTNTPITEGNVPKIDKINNKPLRFNTHAITPSMHRDVLDGKSSAVKSVKSIMGNVSRKLNGYLNMSSKERKLASKITALFETDEDIGDISIALNTTMEAIKGEGDKARKYSIDPELITGGNGTTTTPLARLAAVIGRNIAYTKGVRFKSSKDSKLTPSQVEMLYSQVGIKALKKLQKAGIVNITEGNIINDFVNEENQIPASSVNVDKKIFSGKVVDINISNMYNEHTNKNIGSKMREADALYFNNRIEGIEISPTLNSIITLLGAVNAMVKPTNIVFPAAAPTNIKDLTKDDYGPVTKDFANIRKELNKRPVTVNKRMHKYLKQLSKEFVDSKKSFNNFINDKGYDANDMLAIFGVKDVQSSNIDLRNSTRGQNLSVTSPMEDLLTYYDMLTNDDGTPMKLHMKYDFVRNNRLHTMNTILNAQTDKFSRHILTTGEYKVDKSNDREVYVHLLTQVSDESGFTPSEILNGDNKKLEKALEMYEKAFANESTLDDKIATLSHINSDLNTGSVASKATDFLGAIYDIRNSKDGIITTEYMTKPDATASGGTLTLLQALGSQEDVKKVLTELGMLDGEGKGSKNDIYSLLSSGIEELLSNKGLQLKSTGTSKRDGLQDLVDAGVFKNIRDLSKPTTMTFVYGQGKNGSYKTISDAIIENIFKNINSNDKNIENKAGAYINKLLGENTVVNRQNVIEMNELAAKLTVALTKKGAVVSTLHSILESKVKTILKPYTEMKDEIFTLINDEYKNNPFIKPRQLKIRPASVAMVDIEPTPKNLTKFGIPMTKIQNVYHENTNTGIPTVTMEERPSITSYRVVPIHSVDSYNLYAPLKEVFEQDTSGSVPVHDSNIGSAHLNSALEPKYSSTTKNVTAGYDVLQEGLNLLTSLNPNHKDITALQSKINEWSKSKKKSLESYNPEKNKVFGEDPTEATESINVNDGEVEPKPKNKQPKQPSNDPKETLESHRDKSTIIDNFLNHLNTLNTKLVNSDLFNFDAKTNTINIGSKDSILSDMTETEVIEHEIIHSYVTNYIEEQYGKTKQNIDIRYINKSMKKLMEDIKSGKFSNDRIEYALDNVNLSESDRMNEFVTIMYTEPDTAAKVYEHLDGTIANRLKKFIEDIWSRVQSLLTKPTNKLVEESDINISALAYSINSAVNRGETRKLKVDNSKAIKNERKAGVLYAGPVLQSISNMQDRANEAFYTMVNSRIENQFIKTVTSIDMLLNKAFPMYTEASDKVRGIYKSTPALQQIVHYINAVDFKGAVEKNKILSLILNIKNERNTRDSNTISEINHLTNDMSDEDKDTLYKIISKVPLQNYFSYGPDLATEYDFINRIDYLNKTLNRKQLKIVEAQVKLFTEGKVTNGASYALSSSYNRHADTYKHMQELIALKAIDSIEGGSKALIDMQINNNKLFNIIKDNIMALSLSTAHVLNGDTNNVKDVMVQDQYKEMIEKRVFTKEQARRFDYTEGSGWVIVREATSTKLGLAYREVIDSTFTEGAGTDMSMLSTDISISKELGESYNAIENGIIKVGDKYKLILTDDDKKEMGVERDLAQTLVRSTSHMLAVQDSEIVRNRLLGKELRSIVNSNNDKELEDIEDRIKSDLVDHPWFIKISDEVEYRKLPQIIRDNYKPIQKNLSDVNGFKNEVSLVRKDITHWLIGSNERALANNPKIKRISRIVKQLVSSAKIGMIILNPKKLALDIASNEVYLSTMGVPSVDIASHGKDIMEEMGDLSELKGQITKYKLLTVAYPDNQSYVKRLEIAKQNLENSPLSGAVKHGFITSLSSDILSSNQDTMSGLQADIDKGLKYLFTKDGKNGNRIGNFIIDMANLGFDGEDFLRYIGDKVGRSDSTKSMQNTLDKVADNINRIKTDRDIVRYISQFIISPSNEAVKIGTAANEMADLVAKETYFRYLTQTKGMSEDKAVIEVVTSFPDYKEEMPLAVKTLSDYGILLFPSFWARIQKVMYRMATKKTLNTANMLSTEALLDTHIESILDASLYAKYKGYGFIHSPTDTIGVQSIIPTNLW